jgi:hypothetical protein
MSGPAQTLVAALDFHRFGEIADPPIRRRPTGARLVWRPSAVSLSEIARALPISKISTTGLTPASIPAFARAGKKKARPQQ